MTSLNIYVATCKDRGTGGARHWILIMAEEGSSQATWYHSTRGPTQGKPYSVVIKQKRPNSHGIGKRDFIGQISSKDKNKIKSAAQRTPGLFCQRWVVNVIGDLEKRGVIPQGTWSDWYGATEVDPYSDDGASVCGSSTDGDCSGSSSAKTSFSEDRKS
ncbi:hypothetical protein FLAG1_02368 [Fusarium langsethiae]|uniref:Uncharacterized protein n=1 Tax=Fusarium langsethiae TaxID=179993 RepID=A0A0M9F2T8_FUSLA|nr:hypothetical protein FLAG1_02368 [Fusarium langsethiae]GKU11777.1 unnamed protein product [Fusarium langsethiae]GKU22277.1 unnamed protein product [Fusarium langsethiae]